jgi:ubiquinone/menaquinone biosynthesis C-methylase UbiE
MTEEFIKISEHEKAVWDDIYQKQLDSPQREEFSSFWWKYYYSQIRSVVRELVGSGKNNFKEIKSLEVGSGTGKATLFSIPDTQITFLDMSRKGFELAKILAEKYSASNVQYIEGNMFKIPLTDKSYDFVWNIGTLEHYDQVHIRMIMLEMLRVTNKGGRLAIAIPNHSSLPMLKARLLGHSHLGKYLKCKDVANENNLNISEPAIHRIGSPLFVGSNKFFVYLFKPVELLFPKSKFLLMISANRIS